MITKKCTKCGEEKSFSEFTKDSRLKSGLAAACAECKRKQYKSWVLDNQENKNAYMREYRQRSEARQRVLESQRRSFQRPESKMRAREYRKDPQRRLHNNISRAVRLSLSADAKKGATWEKLLGYDRYELIRHLERQFTPGMSWDNYGEWHIDHIIPQAAFNFSSPNHIDFKRCWALENLQPLWAGDNISKRARLDKPFQPALQM